MKKESFTEREKVYILLGLGITFFLFAMLGCCFTYDKEKRPLIETIVDRTLPEKHGWECPQCHTIYSPDTEACKKCNINNEK